MPKTTARAIVLLKVDQQLAEGPCLRVAPELADPLGPVEVREAEDVEEFGASSRLAVRRREEMSRITLSPCHEKGWRFV